MKTRSTRFLSMLLVVLMIFSLLPMGAFAAETGSDTVTVIACSDFQNKSCTGSNHTAGTNAVQEFLDAIKADGHTDAQGFICCGDYYHTGEDNTTNSINGQKALDSCIKSNFGNDIGTVYIRGNHDWANDGLSSTGAHDTANYGVYVIDEGDYEAYSGSISHSQQLAANLTSYLNAKINEGYTKPIFVVTHVPLHGGTRAAYDNSGLYSKPIVDALLDAGDDLNIIALFGHNHSKDYDAFMGGSSIFLTRGDKMIVGNGDRSNFPEVTLNFTYMNAGYVGYYEDYSNSDNALTMSVFEINGDDVTISRYDTDGLHNLKAAGTRSTYDYNQGYGSGKTQAVSFNKNCTLDTKVYGAEPVTVYGYDESNNGGSGEGDTPAEPKTLIDQPTGIKVVTIGDAITATQKTNVEALSNTSVYSNYVAYDINIAGYTQGTAATVSIPLPAYFAAERTKVFHVGDNGQLTEMNANIADGMVTFATDHFSVYALALQAENTQPVPEAQSKTAESVLVENHSKTIYQYTTSLTPGGKYLITNRNTAGTANMLSHNNANAANATATIKAADKYSNVAYIENPNANAIWTASSGIKLANGGYYLNQSGSIVVGFNVTFATSSSNGESYRYSNSRLTFSTGSLISPTRYLYHATSGWDYTPDAHNVYLFKENTVNWTEDVAGVYSVTANGYSQVVSPDIASSLKATPNYGNATYFTPDGGTKTATTISGARVTYTIAPNGNPNGVISMLDRTNGAITFSGKTGDALVRIAYNWTDANGAAQEIYTDVKVTAQPANYQITALKGGSADDFEYTLLAAGSSIQLTNSLKVNGSALTSPVGNIVWESSNPALASVNNNGKVTFNQAITEDTPVTFTVKYVIDGEVMASDTITATLKWVDPNIQHQSQNYDKETTTETQETVYILTNQMADGHKYLIVNRNDAGTDRHALTRDGTSRTKDSPVTVNSGISATSNKVYIENPNTNSIWTASGSGTAFKIANGNYYLRYNSGLKITNKSSDSGTSWTWNSSDNSLYSSRYLRYNSGWTTANSKQAVYLYEETPITITTTTGKTGVYDIYGTPISVIAEDGYTKNIVSQIQFTKSGATQPTETNITNLGGSYSYEDTNDINDIVSVDQNGKLTFTGNSGVAHVKITYTWTEGNETFTIVDTITVTATEPAQSIDITKGGESVTDTLSQKPAAEGGSIAGTTMELGSVYTKQSNNGDDKTNNPAGAVWTSSDASIATVDSNGVLHFTGKEGAFSVSVSYEVDGKTLTDTVRVSASNSLYVVPSDGTDDFPAWPEEGSVRFDKTAQAVGNFSQTGTAMVELSLTGMPITKNSGIDVIVMMDTSSSMAKTKINGGSEYRSRVFARSFKSLLETLQASDKDIQIAIGDFNGFNSYNGAGSSTPQTSYARDYNLDSTAENSRYGAENVGILYTGTNKGQTGSTANLNESAFVRVKDVDVTGIFNQLDQDQDNKKSGVNYPYKSGTNFDYAFWATYQLGDAIKEYNKENNKSGRELVVIFMTDGSPMQYNGYHAVGQSYNWGIWLDGSLTGDTTSTNPDDYLRVLTKVRKDASDTSFSGTVSNRNAATHSYYFGGIGQYAQKHRWNEAVKGSPDAQYTVIDKLTTDTVDGNQYMTNVPGLGATVYSMGFSITNDNNVEEGHIKHVIQQMASADEYCYMVNNESELDVAFDEIGEAITVEAASDIKVTDKISDEYDVVFGYDQISADPNKFPADHQFYMQYVSYALDDEHERTGAYTVVEKVLVNTDANGTILSATSSTGTPVQIMEGGIGFVAKNFSYNKDTRIAEWYLPNTIETKEYALQYFAYLKDSAFSAVDNQVPADTYPTNDYAYLTYTNANGNACKQEYPIPQMTWNGAQVNYVFYLVNDAGQPVNQAGKVVDFANAVYVTDTFSYAVKWNDENAHGQLQADYLARDKVPAGYTLYDSAAEYTITVYEDESGHNLGNNFTISGAQDIGNKNTTKVFNTKAGTKYDTYGTYQSSAYPTFDFANTTVAFAVKWEAKLVPDTVVIDYGIPTIINVTENDMLTTSVVGIGSNKPSVEIDTGVSNEKLYGDEIKFKDGSTASIENGNNIRFTPGSMKITAPISFYYEATASYTVDDTTQSGYMYSTVTVVPATTVYYEDTHSCIVYNGDWTLAGQDTGFNQDQDRPDIAKLAKSIDADNVYGYDGSYTNYQTYSYGAAHKVTVGSDYYAGHNNSWPTATFSFTGTGFDLISVTSGATGTVVVAVYDSNGNQVANLIDDTYYGYTCQTDAENPYLKQTWKYGSDNMWHMTKSESVADNKLAEGETDVRPNRPQLDDIVIQFVKNYVWTPAGSEDNAIYQVPIIRCTDLDYGTYTVIVRPQYAPFFDHNDNGEYDFYLDAVRIYNPAMNSGAANAVYAQDKEASPQFIEIRENLLDASVFDNNQDDVPGIVFIDGVENIGNESISDYQEYGPNHEVYLKSGQAIAFKLDDKDADYLASAQIGMKLTAGAKAKVNVAVLGGKSKDIKLSTATDMYYDITDIISGNINDNVIVITNNGDSMVSLTNIKLTHSVLVVNRTTPMMSAPAAKSAAKYVSTLMLQNIPEAPEVFEPVVKVAVPETVKQDDTITVTVTTSNEVAYITVNGEAVNSSTVNDDDTLTWTYEVKAEQVGSMSFAVTAYSESGMSVDAGEQIVTVQANEPAHKSNIFETIWNWFVNLFKH